MLSRSRVWRGLCVLETDAYDEAHCVSHRARLALARCRHCGCRQRVLPCDVLARKRYALSVIGAQLAQYSEGQWSLREVAWDLLGERTPSPSTLHGWSEGLGAHVLDWVGSVGHGAPFGRVLAQWLKREPQLSALWHAPAPPVDPRRYRREERRERLAAVAHLMGFALAFSGAAVPEALGRCRALSLLDSPMPTLGFPSRWSCTGIQQAVAKEAAGCEPCCVTCGTPECPTRIRSPPGASSKSRRSLIVV